MKITENNSSINLPEVFVKSPILHWINLINRQGLDHQQFACHEKKRYRSSPRRSRLRDNGLFGQTRVSHHHLPSKKEIVQDTAVYTHTESTQEGAIVSSLLSSPSEV